MNVSSPQKSNWKFRLQLLLFLAMVVVSFLVGRSMFATRVNMAAVVQLNSAGVAAMEMLDPNEGVRIFTKVHEMAPDWIPGSINLAIAHLNVSYTESNAIVERLCLEVLAKDANNPHAHYVLGLLHLFGEKRELAYPHFEAVTKVDPKDAFSWAFMADAHPKGNDSLESFNLYQKSLTCDPNYNGARYRVAFHPQNDLDFEHRKKMLDEHSKLRDNFWESSFKIRYGEMGPYARVIDHDTKLQSKANIDSAPMFEKCDHFKVELAPETHWAKHADLDPFVRHVRETHGATIVLFDYNRDGRIDILMLGAVIENGVIRNLLLRNDGEGKFTDVTRDAGLAEPLASIGCAVGDFDNNGFPDLFISGVGKQKLYRNTGKGGFEDVSAKSGVSQIKGICISAAWVDLDQDADLDLVIARYSTEAGPWRADLPPGNLLVLMNNGSAAKNEAGKFSGPLSCEFEEIKDVPGLRVDGKIMGITLTDFDADQDVDLLIHTEDKIIPIRNDRLMRFQQLQELSGAWPKAPLGMVLDVNHDGRSDLFLLNAEKPRLLLSHAGFLEDDPAKWFREVEIESPPLMQARAIDLDLDGWTDVVGLSKDRKPVFLQNNGFGRLVQRKSAFDADLPADLLSFAFLDLDGDNNSDLLVWSEAQGLVARRNSGNGNKCLRIELVGGHLDDFERSNGDAIGSRVIVHAGLIWNSAEFTTLSAGLGQSLVPLEFGIGRHQHADVVRIRWPDLVPQAEIKLPAGPKQTVRANNRMVW